ncbi:hypothetical protein FC70_GL000121 [Paucilactobacillus oligofermentans DSM 15707 = LMG 22743]|uniref:LicD/FKTN/FKRP nucleotidyltransferase domain-containing protein n=1 Tax=Paucilactobacillus oligofermentans DSM 15707 = LMG 22743 TaxID=1423778 RepID=A0A0R1RLG3_9LACO|nr:LicD family protein [Paucilactobacillus oligofermentans]KRL58048.1 hypothetical protein FC70_GL000121 [Paucilactobacillus oligofermentans DSM 15707 = LMG 22743]CUS26954.1 Protein LicD [Paucilactobacillus oligofermentans DSM 15707 = LMG 22743]
MGRINDVDSKKIILGLLREFDSICRNNNIEYSLSGGTLLGAIRHKGFIPWDDDGDVMLTRKNYEKIKYILNNRHLENMEFLSEENVGYYYLFSKLSDSRTRLEVQLPQDMQIQSMGIFIDIFPIDKIPVEQKELKEYSFQLIQMHNDMKFSIPGYYYFNSNPFKQFVKYILRFNKYSKLTKKNTKDIQNRLKNMLTKYDTTNALNAGFLLSEYHEKEIVPYSTFLNYKDVTFEGTTLRIITAYDIYLHALYGDYMQLPSKKQRDVKHAYRSFWK